MTVSLRKESGKARAAATSDGAAGPAVLPAPSTATSGSDDDDTGAVVLEEWQRALDEYSNFMIAAGAAATTLRIYLHYLGRLAARGSAPFDIGVDELAGFLAVRAWKPATRKTARSAVRSFYRWARLTHRIDEDPALVLPPVRVPRGRPRPAPDEALHRAFLRACPRDRLMVMLAAYAGLRRGEIALAHTDDVLGDVLRVHGKGGVSRDVPLHPVLASAIAKLPRGFLFPGMVDGHLSADRVGHILAELLGAGWTGHTLRHRFLSLGYLAERDILAVQQLAGHAKLDSTMVYTQVPDGALMRAVMAAGPSAA